MKKNDPTSAPTQGPALVVARVEELISAMGTQLKHLKAHEGDAAERRKAVLQLRQQLEEFAQLAPELGGLEKALEEQSERQFLELESAIREACARKGWRVEGQWPALYVERGIAIEIDSAKHSVSVAGKSVGGATVSRIVEKLEPLIRELLPKDFSPLGFISELVTAYDAARGDSAQVPLFSVYKKLVINSQNSRLWRNAIASAFKPLSADQFRARLSAVLAEGLTAAPDGRELRLLPPLDPKDGLFVFQPAENRYGFIGRLEFVSAPDPERP